MVECIFLRSASLTSRPPVVASVLDALTVLAACCGFDPCIWHFGIYILCLRSCFVADQTLYIVMEHAPGGDLQASRATARAPTDRGCGGGGDLCAVACVVCVAW